MKVEEGLEGGAVYADWHDLLMAKRHPHQSEVNKSSLEQDPFYKFLFLFNYYSWINYNVSKINLEIFMII